MEAVYNKMVLTKYIATDAIWLKLDGRRTGICIFEGREYRDTGECSKHLKDPEKYPNDWEKLPFGQLRILWNKNLKEVQLRYKDTLFTVYSGKNSSDKKEVTFDRLVSAKITGKSFEEL